MKKLKMWTAIMAVLISLMAGISVNAKDVNDYTDVPKGVWFHQFVEYVSAEGLMTGLNETSFGPSDTLVRAQFATILYRIEGEPDCEYKSYYEDVKDEEFYSIPVTWASENKIINGYDSNGLFGTNDPITREQLATMLYRYAVAKNMDTSVKVDFSGYPDSGSVSEFAQEAMSWAVGTGLIKGDRGYLKPQGSVIRAECATMIARFHGYEEVEPPMLPGTGITIVLDPGHSSVVENKMEPLGPGAWEMKAGDTSGTQGVATGIPEYVFTLDVALKLRTELEYRGYTVVMTRESNDVPRSCVERAEIMNNANAAACVRIHANGSSNQSAQGAMTICTTPNSPYVSHLYSESRRLSDCVLNRYVEATGCRKEYVWETDTMSGNNWSQIPVTIIETGYMSNPYEDVLLASDDYKAKIVQGIANGIQDFVSN